MPQPKTSSRSTQPGPVKSPLPQPRTPLIQTPFVVPSVSPTVTAPPIPEVPLIDPPMVDATSAVSPVPPIEVEMDSVPPLVRPGSSTTAPPIPMDETNDAGRAAAPPSTLVIYPLAPTVCNRDSDSDRTDSDSEGSEPSSQLSSPTESVATSQLSTLPLARETVRRYSRRRRLRCPRAPLSPRRRTGIKCQHLPEFLLGKRDWTMRYDADAWTSLRYIDHIIGERLPYHFRTPFTSVGMRDIKARNGMGCPTCGIGMEKEETSGATRVCLGDGSTFEHPPAHAALIRGLTLSVTARQTGPSPVATTDQIPDAKRPSEPSDSKRVPEPSDVEKVPDPHDTKRVPVEPAVSAASVESPVATPDPLDPAPIVAVHDSMSAKKATLNPVAAVDKSPVVTNASLASEASASTGAATSEVNIRDAQACASAPVPGPLQAVAASEENDTKSPPRAALVRRGATATSFRLVPNRRIEAPSTSILAGLPPWPEVCKRQANNHPELPAPKRHCPGAGPEGHVYNNHAPGYRVVPMGPPPPRIVMTAPRAAINPLVGRQRSVNTWLQTTRTIRRQIMHYQREMTERITQQSQDVDMAMPFIDMLSAVCGWLNAQELLIRANDQRSMSIVLPNPGKDLGTT